MIQLYECPNCGRESAAFVSIETSVYCPACAPTPDKVAHDYRPIMLGGVALNLISGVCCADAGDCGHECGIA